MREEEEEKACGLCLSSLREGGKNFNLDSAIDQPKWFSVGFSLQSPRLVDKNIVKKKRKKKYCVHPSQGDVFRQNSPPHSYLTVYME